METGTVHIEEVTDGRSLADFIDLSWEIYRGNACWVPPLLKEIRSRLSPSHPFRSHAEMALFVARRNGRARGRIAAIVDRNFIDFQQEKTGFFGFFESVEDTEVAGALFDRAEAWLKERGMKKMIGPMNPSTNDECGLLVDGFNAPARIMMPYNPPFYPSLVEETGLARAMDLYAYWLDQNAFCLDRFERIIGRMQRRNPGLRVRPLEMRHLDRELTIVKEIYNQVWSRNWGFVPLTEAEIDMLARDLKPILVPDLVLFAYDGDEPVAFSVSLPDYNVVLRHLNGRLGPLGALKFLYYRRRIDAIRVMLLGVKEAHRKRGIEVLLYLETFRRGTAKGYPGAECSWILETNHLMRRGIEAMGGKIYKTYRVYERPIAGSSFPSDPIL